MYKFINLHFPCYMYTHTMYGTFNMKPHKYKDYRHQKKKAGIFISLFLSLCDSDEFLFFVVRYTHLDEMFSCYAWRLSKHDAKTLPELQKFCFVIGHWSLRSHVRKRPSPGRSVVCDPSGRSDVCCLLAQC